MTRREEKYEIKKPDAKHRGTVKSLYDMSCCDIKIHIDFSMDVKAGCIVCGISNHIGHIENIGPSHRPVSVRDGSGNAQYSPAHQ